MSAIFGIVHFDGKPVAQAELELMNNALAAHGPDGNGVRIERHVGLGQRLMRFTPEDCLERQPAVDAGGQLVLVSDARIDNRPELMDELGIPHMEARELPDSAFILRACQRWGFDGPRHLVGAFVFALYDLRAQTVLIARSPMGERSLFYHEAAGSLAFASAPKGLFALPFVPRGINAQSIADLLTYAAKEPGSSLFSGIRRLQPGHSIIAGRDGFEERRYHMLEGLQEIRFSHDRDYVEAFSELFDLVIKRQMRSLTPAGVSMSGGLDSTAIAAVMAEELGRKGERLQTFTEVPPAGFRGAVPKGRYADETPFVQAMARMYGNIDLHFVHSSPEAYLNGLDGFFEAIEAPVRNASNRPWIEAILHEASGRSVRTLMTGVPGNVVFSYAGEGLLEQLVQKGKWRQALHEAGALASRGGSRSTLRTLVSGGVMPLAPDWVWHALQRRKAGWRDVAARPPWHDYSPVRLEFARAQRVEERARAKGEDFRFRSSGKHRARFLLQQADPHSDVRRGDEAMFGVQKLDPGSDERLVEFCLSIPEDQYLRDGQPRWLIRRAMAGRLPVEVLDNRLRGQQSANWTRSITSARARLEALLGRIERSALAAEVIDLPRMGRLLEQIQDVRTNIDTATSCRETLDRGLMVGSFLAWTEGVS
jgi:asparagine synthase (glutamine-hydrolysing)